MSKTHSNILFILFIYVLGACFLSCQKEEREDKIDKSSPRVIYAPESQQPLVAFVRDSTNNQNLQLEGQIRKPLGYSKIPYQHIDLNELNKKASIKNSVRVLVVQDVSILSDVAITAVIKFVVEGGTLFLPQGNTDRSFGFFAGVKKDATYKIDFDAIGLDFKVALVPDFKGKTIKNGQRHYGLEASNFDENIEFIATSSSNPAYPLIIKNKMGVGKVIAFNTQLQPEKRNRGIYFGCMLYGLNGIPYPVANVSSIFLDDFPAPLYNLKMEPVASEMNVTQAAFYTDYWWPDLLKLAKDENLEYTTYVCFDYRNLTEPPFNFKEWEIASTNKGNHTVSAPDWLMQEVRNSKHELGFHGYNHVSLIKKDWNNPSFMGLGLRAVKKRWEARAYGNLPVSYVPPSNDIDSIGIVALAYNMPSLKYNSSLYHGTFEEGGEREFDPEPFAPQLFNYPRVTSGYIMNNSRQFSQQSLYLYTGIWTHFIHADDIYQIPSNDTDSVDDEYGLRNIHGYGWHISENGSPGLLPRFREYLKHIRELFPLSRYLTVDKAAPITRSWREATFQHSIKKNSYTVKTTSKTEKNQPFYWFYYAEENDIKNIENKLESKDYRFHKIPLLDGALFNIETNSGSLTLPVTQHKEEKLLTYVDFKAYKGFLDEEGSPQQDTETQITNLKIQLAGSAIVSEKSWFSLFKYLGWQSREKEIWPLLENTYNKLKSNSLVVLADKFIAHSDYPDMETRKRWMQRQIANDPQDLELKMRYVSYFGEDQNVQIQMAELINIFENEKSIENRTSTVDLLIKKYPETASSFLSKIDAENLDYNKAAKNIMWFFADQENYLKAIAWSKKVETIDVETVDNWRLQTGDYEFLKEKDFPKYINYLLGYNPKKATAALIDKTPCMPVLLPQATAIAYEFGNQGSYRKAIAWSKCAVDFPLVNQLQWYYGLKDTKAIDAIYTAHIQNNIPTEALKGFMADYYIGRAQFVNAWKMAESLKNSDKRETLRLQYNKDVVFAESETQKLLMNENPDFFYPETLARIKKDLRIATGDFLELENRVISDRFEPTSLGNAIFYGIRDSRLNEHKFGISQFRAYPLIGNFDARINKPHDLYGIAYEFKELPKPNTFSYGAGGKIEFDDEGKTYYHINTSAAITKDSLYASVQIFRRPAITGPAYSLNIYQTQLNMYSELRMKKNYQAIFYLESNQFDDQGALDATALINFGKNFKLNQSVKIKGYAEISGMLGNTDQRQGYPYWTINERLYGGLGVSYNYANNSNKLQFSLDASSFLDTFSEQFQRYRGQLNVPLFNYLHLEANAEFFTLKDFYSNSFGLGLRYYLN
ncbi:DUF2194 domain-containing protein [Flavimarina sp. Hel_I_48]|uniref:DUF2194 domain-containing protein n=1 Tax=Flavimarina sp. Hel_I_48 TaxID=1392488 RepID=UPI0004DFBB95|nr:DUF2194 domain-containing protein [Flavimarina sp. Hel_I_48]